MKQKLIAPLLATLALVAAAAAQYRGTYIPNYAYPITPAAALATETNPAKLDVDAGQAWRGILHVTETMPVQTGLQTLVYPEWIPGEHGPTGPIDELAALRLSAGGKTVSWQRDPTDMYAFYVTVPAGAATLTAQFDVLMNDASGVMATVNMAILNWNRALLYQAGVDSHTYFFQPSITLPDQWSFATALTEQAQPVFAGGSAPDASRRSAPPGPLPRQGAPQGEHIQFDTLSLAMLVDSPLDMGRYAQKWTLWQQGDAYVQLDAFAAKPQNLDIPPALLQAYQRVPAEAFALYGSRHFANYHALLTLSDQIGFEGIEHHQSSDNRAPDGFLTDPTYSLADGDLITHEFSHSWNGKYRRPADLATPNFQVPMRTDLLWVYEGMNQYLGDLLSFRSGIRDPKDYPEYLATLYAQMAVEPGRQTTPVIALTTAAPFLYQASNAYNSTSRTAGDFYTEGELVWLDVDTLIRTESHGKKSLDDFLHLYSLPTLTDPITDTYSRDQIEALLNQVQPYDWHSFFEKTIYAIAPQPPDVLTRAGWKLVYTAEPNKFITAETAANQGDDERWYDLGLTATAEGTIKGVREGSPAWTAGLAQGARLVAVNGQSYSEANLDYAVQQAQSTAAPITLVVTASGQYQTLEVDYHDGLKYPHLVRIPGTTDLLAAIMAPHAP